MLTLVCYPPSAHTNYNNSLPLCNMVPSYPTPAAMYSTITAQCRHLLLLSTCPTTFTRFPLHRNRCPLDFHSVPQRTLQVLYCHTPIPALPLTLEHHDSSCVEHLVRHTRITPFPKGCSNHMGCLSAPPLLLLFEYHNYYPP